jgi:hypothetical protein
MLLCDAKDTMLAEDAAEGSLLEPCPSLSAVMFRNQTPSPLSPSNYGASHSLCGTLLQLLKHRTLVLCCDVGVNSKVKQLTVGQHSHTTTPAAAAAAQTQQGKQVGFWVDYSDQTTQATKPQP